MFLCRENRINFPIARLKPNAYFGENSFFTGHRPNFSAVTSKFTTVFVLSRKEFLLIVKENQNDFVNFEVYVI